jgi:hypothetical protein
MFDCMVSKIILTSLSRTISMSVPFTKNYWQTLPEL